MFHSKSKRRLKSRTRKAALKTLGSAGWMAVAAVTGCCRAQVRRRWSSSATTTDSFIHLICVVAAVCGTDRFFVVDFFFAEHDDRRGDRYRPATDRLRRWWIVYLGDNDILQFGVIEKFPVWIIRAEERGSLIRNEQMTFLLCNKKLKKTYQHWMKLNCEAENTYNKIYQEYFKF